MNTPYTTKSGLRIGSAIEARQRIEHSADMLRLQRALLPRTKPTLGRIDWDGIAIVLSCLMAVGLMLLPFWMR